MHVTACYEFVEADLVVIPSKPTAPDLAAIGRTISLVEEHKKSFVFIITQITVRTKAAIQAASVLSKFGALAPSSISNRIAYATAMGTGLTAVNTDKIAAEEISQVWNFIKNIIFPGKENNKKKLNIG